MFGILVFFMVFINKPFTLRFAKPFAKPFVQPFAKPFAKPVASRAMPLSPSQRLPWSP